jgi:hypothetical protein
MLLTSATTRVFPFGVFLFPGLSIVKRFGCVCLFLDIRFRCLDLVIGVHCISSLTTPLMDKKVWFSYVTVETLQVCLTCCKSAESSRIKSFFFLFVTPFWATPIGFQVDNLTILLLSSFLAACLESLASLVHLQLENLETLWRVADH